MTEEIQIFAERLESRGIDRMLHSADTVAVALSGGADSSLLLCLLKEYLADGRTRLVACHLNHMIRGEEAYRDEEFSRRLCEHHDVPFYLKRVDIPSLVGNGVGVEETARRERYAFFDELTSSLGGRVLVATAHNADDNFETVLFNLVRGTGGVGLCGIPPIRDGKYIRPLLDYTSEEIRAEAARLGIEYVVDSTNLSTDYTRNKLRHLVIPHLRELNPSACRAVLRMSDSLRRDEAHFKRELDAVMSQVSPGGALPLELLLSLDSAMLPRALVALHEKFAPSGAPSLESIHLREAERLLRDSTGDFELSVPGGVSFFCRGGSCFFSSGDEKACEADTSVTPLRLDEPIRKNGYIILATEQKAALKTTEYENIYNLSIHAQVKFDTIKDKLEVRTRNEGDAYRFGGMTRRLKRLFSDRHIPQDERARLPIICDSGGILWVPSFPVRDGARPTAKERALNLFCIREESARDISELLGLTK